MRGMAADGRVPIDAFMKTPKQGKQQPRLTPAEQKALQTFSDRMQQPLARLRQDAQQIQELLGRWEQLTDGAPGLLGGSLLTFVNEAVLDKELGRLAGNLARTPAEPSDVADHADFFGGLLGEYAALLKVLTEIELEPGSPLSRDWDKLSDDILQQGSEIQKLAEDLEVAVEAEEEEQGAGRESPAAGLRPASRAFLREIWQKAQAGEPLSGDLKSLAEAMRAHPEYKVAWETPGEEIGERDFTIHGVNPFVHVTMHVAVENQLAEGEPAAAKAALERFTAAGLDRHEAVHRIANALVEQIWRIQGEGRPFDRSAYIQALKKLS